MIWIRADANGKVGTGHIMRCLAIAQALERLGEQVCFLVADENPVPLLEERGQEFRVLGTDYTRMEEELPFMAELAARAGTGFLLVDSYFATAEYLWEMRKRMPVGRMDDMCRAELPSDLLINYNLYAEEAFDKAVREKTKMLLGAAYAPLREEFAGVDYPVRKRAEQVLVTTGGSDRYNLAGRLLKEALARRETAELRYLVVSGLYNEYLPRLLEIQNRFENVKVCCNVGNMAELMKESDIAVSAGGSTLYELGAVGVPMICFSFVDNQERIVEAFTEKGLSCFGGNYLTGGDAMIAEAAEEIGRLAPDFALRRDFSERLRRVVDGRGAMRIAEELKGMCQGAESALS